MDRINYSSGAPLEESAGYSRMVKIGEQVIIGGTTAVMPDGTVYSEDPKEQAQYIFRKFGDLLERAGATYMDVYKVKAYITDMGFAREVAEAYTEIFRKIRPLFTMVETPKLNRPAQKVEIELEASIGNKIISE